MGYDIKLTGDWSGWSNVFRITGGDKNLSGPNDRQLAVFIHSGNKQLHTTITTKGNNNMAMNGPTLKKGVQYRCLITVSKKDKLFRHSCTNLSNKRVKT